MELCVIPPIDMLRTLTGEGRQKIHLCLAHLVLKSSAYAQFYKSRGEAGDYVILDNSAYEFKGSMDLDDIVRAMRRINPRQVVLPDFLNEKIKTLDATAQACQYIREDVEFMVVPQGRHYEEWGECLEEMLALKEDRITTIGLPACTDSWNKGRFPMITKVPQPYYIHMLGWGSGAAAATPIMVESIYPKRVRSIDTAKAVYYGMEMRPIVEMFYTAAVDVPRRPTNYFESSWSAVSPIQRKVETNISVLRDLIKTRKSVKADDDNEIDFQRATGLGY